MTAAEPALAPDAAFWNRIARKYAARPVGDEAAYREKLRRTREVFPPEAHVLEFGCGTGSTALEHAPHAARYLAADVAPEMIAIAQEKRGDAAQPEFRAATLAEIAAEGGGGTFDAVLGLNILHLVPDWREHIGMAHDLLKPGGALVTSTFTGGDRMRWIRPLVWAAQRLGKAPLLVYISEAELRAAHEAAGFVIEDAWRPKHAAALFLIARKPA